jgi:CheY-like chemotaxis protein
MSNLSLNILLSEDNQDDLTLFQMALDKAKVSARLQTVRDGEEAIDYLKGENDFSDRKAHPLPDLILLDLNMPRRNGFEVLEWIRQDAIYKHLMVHVLTASCREVDVRRAYDLHANSYIVKPSRVNELVSFITGLINWHRFVCLSPAVGGSQRH